jgi:hypothetical protein
MLSYKTLLHISRMSNDNILVKGQYTSQSGRKLDYEMAKWNDGRIMVGFTEGISKGIRDAKLITSEKLDGRVFYVSQDEFDYFKTNILNKNVQWAVENKDEEHVTIPGTWSGSVKSVSGGRRAKSLKSRKSRKSLKSRRTRR